MVARIVRMSALGRSYDAGLLTLRVTAFLSLFLKHGYEKIFNFAQMSQNFSDPFHIGHVPSLICAMISDSICSILLILGLATRWACLYSFTTIFVAWSLRHGFPYFEKGGVGDHGELIILYLACLLAVFVAGPGRYSLDAIIFKSDE